MKCWWIFGHTYAEWQWIAYPVPKESFMGSIPWIAGFWKQCEKCSKKKYRVGLVPEKVALAGPRKFLGIE